MHINNLIMILSKYQNGVFNRWNKAHALFDQWQKKEKISLAPFASIHKISIETKKSILVAIFSIMRLCAPPIQLNKKAPKICWGLSLMPDTQ